MHTTGGTTATPQPMPNTIHTYTESYQGAIIAEYSSKNSENICVDKTASNFQKLPKYSLTPKKKGEYSRTVPKSISHESMRMRSMRMRNMKHNNNHMCRLNHRNPTWLTGMGMRRRMQSHSSLSS